jgi:4'-phosphopantetheinyl transferase
VTDKSDTNQHQYSYDVDIVCFYLDSHPQEHERLYPLLNNDEKKRANRYRFDVHRRRFINSRGKLREILAEKANCRPDEINFEIGKYGKPYISAPVSLKQIHFNASASGPIGAVAISTTTSLGFDLEQIQYEGRRDFDLIVKNECTIDEVDWYSQYKSNTDRSHAFYALWTCKEAYLKALGVGLSKGLDKFSVNLRGNTPLITHTQLESNDQSDLFLYQMKLADDVISCLALAKANCETRIIYHDINRI